MHKRITVVLSEEEYTQIRNNAGLVPLSRFLKNLGLADESRITLRGPLVQGEVGETFAANLVKVVVDNVSPNHRAEDVPRAEAIPAAKRRGGRVERVSAPIEPCKHGAYPGFCKHEECRK